MWERCACAERTSAALGEATLFVFVRLNCCSARRLGADRRGNVLIPFDSEGSNDDDQQHPGCNCGRVDHARLSVGYNGVCDLASLLKTAAHQ